MLCLISWKSDSSHLKHAKSRQKYFLAVPSALGDICLITTILIVKYPNRIDSIHYKTKIVQNVFVLSNSRQTHWSRAGTLAYRPHCSLTACLFTVIMLILFWGDPRSPSPICPSNLYGSWASCHGNKEYARHMVLPWKQLICSLIYSSFFVEGAGREDGREVLVIGLRKK